MFWPASRRRELRDILTAQEPTSILMLKTDIDKLWDVGSFCLDPIEPKDYPDPKFLRLTFLWLHSARDETSALTF